VTKDPYTGSSKLAFFLRPGSRSSHYPAQFPFYGFCSVFPYGTYCLNFGFIIFLPRQKLSFLADAYFTASFALGPSFFRPALFLNFAERWSKQLLEIADGFSPQSQSTTPHGFFSFLSSSPLYPVFYFSPQVSRFFTFISTLYHRPQLRDAPPCPKSRTAKYLQPFLEYHH